MRLTAQSRLQRLRIDRRRLLSGHPKGRDAMQQRKSLPGAGAQPAEPDRHDADTGDRHRPCRRQGRQFRRRAKWQPADTALPAGNHPLRWGGQFAAPADAVRYWASRGTGKVPYPGQAWAARRRPEYQCRVHDDWRAVRAVHPGSAHYFVTAWRGRASRSPHITTTDCSMARRASPSRTLSTVRRGM